MVSKELGKYVELGGGFNYSIVDFTFGPGFLKEVTGKLFESIDSGSITEEDIKERLMKLFNIGADYDIFTGKLYQKYDSTDDEWNPIDGIYSYVSEEYMGGYLPGDINAYRFVGDVRKFIPITHKATMAFRIRSGFVHEFGDTEEVPYAERFFTGGAFSVRGYGEQRLGPTGPSGDPLGARILGLGNAEFRFQLPFVDGVVVPGIKLDLSPFWGGLFFDAGNVWDSAKEIRKESLRYGAGLGIRYNTPVGPVRLDYGRELSLDGASGKYGVFYIAFGNAF
jgi:outer membrane protein assembly factor BamA